MLQQYLTVSCRRFGWIDSLGFPLLVQRIVDDFYRDDDIAGKLWVEDKTKLKVVIMGLDNHKSLFLPLVNSALQERNQTLQRYGRLDVNISCRIWESRGNEKVNCTLKVKYFKTVRYMSIHVSDIFMWFLQMLWRKILSSWTVIGSQRWRNLRIRGNP